MVTVHRCITETAASQWLVRWAVLIALAITWSNTQAVDVLADCRSLSNDVDDIHNCLDNYLDAMDDNLADLGTYIERELQGSALLNYQTSQAAFQAYRQANCLWYLDLTNTREDSEQVAKNCLVRMSVERFTELQTLLATASQRQNNFVSGYYVYGANRNSFQPCGSEKRYWVEGENTLIGELQQTYLNLANADLQLMYVVVVGEPDDSVQNVAGHDGVFNITNMTEMRLPQESDCRLPTVNTAAVNEIEPTNLPSASITPVESDVSSEQSAVGEVFQELRAYFGDWQVDCRQNQNTYSCELLVPFAEAGKKASEAEGDFYASAPATLLLQRRIDKRTTAQLSFPNREIDSVAKIRWRVDNYTFGDIIGSDIRVDETATRQLVTERKFIRDDFLPLLIQGTELGVEVLDNVENSRGERFTATLLGLT
nr:DUF1311 domain-containing protein [Granulosicoccus sp.]